MRTLTRTTVRPPHFGLTAVQRADLLTRPAAVRVIEVFLPSLFGFTRRRFVRVELDGEVRLVRHLFEATRFPTSYLGFDVMEGTDPKLEWYLRSPRDL